MQKKDTELNQLFQILARHEEKFDMSFSLVPSENMLSPLARQLLSSDMYSRYFFDDDRLWGNWAFQGGRHVGEIQEHIVTPILKRLTGCDYITTKPVSGLSCMMVAMSAYCQPGDEILCLPGELGGHSSTAYVAERLGLKVSQLKSSSDFDFDAEWLSDYLKNNDVKLVYIDQANNLFPIDIKKIKEAMTAAGKDTFLHVDASHINGLILGGVLENPIQSGADSFGGSLHKTFPGPHKGFIATNNKDIHSAIKDVAAHLVSHSHSAETLALAASLIEFEQCGGSDYAKQIVANAKAFGGAMDAAGFKVAKQGEEFTRTHQVWLANTDGKVGNKFSDQLYEAGILVNSFGGLPIFPEGGLRIGLNEATRLGLLQADVIKLAKFFEDILKGADLRLVKAQVRELRAEFPTPKFCFQQDKNYGITGPGLTAKSIMS